MNKYILEIVDTNNDSTAVDAFYNSISEALEAANEIVKAGWYDYAGDSQWTVKVKRVIIRSSFIEHIVNLPALIT